MGEGNTCDVCGGSETKLVDGFYYCAECGTQDTNVRETIVEHTVLADGTFAQFTKAKYSVKIKDGVKMSAEWYMWHACNFVLAGLAESMLKLGAEPSFKMKVLWIWAKFIKKHQNKKLMGLTEADSGLKDKTTTGHVEEEQNEEKNDELDDNDKPPSFMSLKILVGILYLALNLDRSMIQPSHFRRYMKNGKLPIHRSFEYIPKEIDKKSRELRKLCYSTHLTFTPSSLLPILREFEDLDLGPHLVPDLEGITDNLLKELCLPKDMKNLVMSLMNFAPVNFLDKRKGKKSTVILDCEYVVMSYILVALKMCFGLDDDYEKRLSDVVDEINYQENHLKAYKSDLYLEPSERLFSFREWSKYLLYRKHMLCKYYLPIAKECNLFLDDYVYMEHSKRKANKEVKLSDEVTMDIINKIPEHNDFSVIPISEFEPSLTPIATHTDVISRHLRDPEKRQLLSEDFTQYSINYACQDLCLQSCSEETSENIIVGVCTTGKIKNDLIGIHLLHSLSDSTIVYVKKCENRNWSKTKRPTAEHIVKEDSDHGYDSNIENPPNKSSTNLNTEETIQDVENTCNSTSTEDTKDKKLQVFDEEEEGNNIFDDNFLDIDTEDTKLDDTIQKFGNDFSETMETLQYEDSYHENNEIEDSKFDIQSHSVTDIETDAKPTFDPETFNREETIKKLMISVYQEYKVPVPQKFRPQERIKRKAGPNVAQDEPHPKRAKRDKESKRLSLETKDQVKEIMSAYYRSLQEEVLHEVSQQVRSIVENVEQNSGNVFFDQNSFTANNNNSVTERNDYFDAIIENGDGSAVERNLEHTADEAATEENQDNLDQNDMNDGDKSDDETILDPVYKGEPKFDEKTHDAKQLYLKVKDKLVQNDLLDIENDEEINTLIEKKIQQSKKPFTETVDSDFDSSDDLPLSHFIRRKDKKKYKSLVKNPEELGVFNYWFKHYVCQVLKRGSYGKLFDADMRESFPKSFVFVVDECAFVLNCPTWILYRYMTDIEEEMLQKDGFEKKKKSYKGTGVVFDRRDQKERYDRMKKMKLSSQGQ